MYQFDLSGIPVGVVQNHNEALHYWVSSGIKNAVLLHINAHPNMQDQAKFENSLSESSYEQFKVSNFICPAVYHGIVTSIYWLNPHSQSKKLQDLGAANSINGRSKLEVILKKQFFALKRRYVWKADNISNLDLLRKGEGKVISPKEMEINGHFILNIGLDAFCCHSDICNVSNEYDGLSDFEKRMDETAELLSSFRQPSLITLSRSQGGSFANSFVPSDKVNDVHLYLMRLLREIY